jgi:hypothetical protein
MHGAMESKDALLVETLSMVSNMDTRCNAMQAMYKFTCNA